MTTTIHTHTHNSARLKAEAVINVIIERCIKKTTPIPTIYEDEMAKLRSAHYIDINFRPRRHKETNTYQLRSVHYMDTNPDHDNVISELSTFYENRMSPYRSRNKETQNLPITRTDIQLEGNLTNIVSADIIYGYGTFYTSPTQFTQLYTQWSTMSCTNAQSMF